MKKVVVIGVALSLLSGGVWAKGISSAAVEAAAVKGSQIGASAAIKADLLPTQLDQLTQLKKQVDQMNQQVKTAGDQLKEALTGNGLLTNQLNSMEQNLWQWGGASIMNGVGDINSSYASEQAALYDQNSLYFKREDNSSVSASGDLDVSAKAGTDNEIRQARRQYSNAKAAALAAGRNAKDIDSDSRSYTSIKGDNADANGALMAAQIGNSATIANGQQLVKLREAIDTQTTMAANAQAQAAERQAQEAAWQKQWFANPEKSVGHSKLDMDNMFKAK